MSINFSVIINKKKRLRQKKNNTKLLNLKTEPLFYTKTKIVFFFFFYILKKSFEIKIYFKYIFGLFSNDNFVTAREIKFQ